MMKATELFHPDHRVLVWRGVLHQRVKAEQILYNGLLKDIPKLKPQIVCTRFRKVKNGEFYKSEDVRAVVNADGEIHIPDSTELWREF